MINEKLITKILIMSLIISCYSYKSIEAADRNIDYSSQVNNVVMGNGSGENYTEDSLIDGEVSGYTFNLLPGSKAWDAYGASTHNADAVNNTLTANNSSVIGYKGTNNEQYFGWIVGGRIEGKGNGTDNILILNGGDYGIGLGANIWGVGSVLNNKAVLNDGNINIIMGGSVYSDNPEPTSVYGNSIGNVAIINGGNVKEYVAGGEVSFFVVDGDESYNTGGELRATVKDNSVEINNGTIKGSVYGGTIFTQSNKNSVYDVRDNTVIWRGGTIDGNIYGDHISDINESNLKNVWNENSNSTFNFYASSSNSNKTITGIGNFKNYNFYLDDTVQPNTTLINVKNSVDLSKSNIGVAMTSNAKLSKGDSVTLLSSSQGIKTSSNLVNDVSHMDNNLGRAYGENVYDVYDFGLYNDGNNLKATVGNVSPNTKNEIIPESRQPEVAFLDDKLDIVDTVYNMSVGKSEPVVYFDFNYTDVKKDNVTMRGSENVLGSALTKGDEEKKNTITQGPFLEYGDGSFGGKNFYSTGDVDASGKTEKYGTGYLFRQVRAGRHHYDAYFRLGKIKNDFRSHMYGVGNVNYDNSDMYYAAHLGYGQYIPIDHHTKMDVYGKYFYKLIPGTSTTTHVNSDTDINTDFDKLDSHKFRIGSKITWDYMQEKKKMMFADVAIEHELSHTQRTTLGDRVTSNSSGADTTGVIEIGYRQVFGPKDAFLFTADLQGYVGTRSGLGGNIGVRFNF